MGSGMNSADRARVLFGSALRFFCRGLHGCMTFSVVSSVSALAGRTNVAVWVCTNLSRGAAVIRNLSAPRLNRDGDGREARTSSVNEPFRLRDGMLGYSGSTEQVIALTSAFELSSTDSNSELELVTYFSLLPARTSGLEDTVSADGHAPLDSCRWDPSADLDVGGLRSGKEDCLSGSRSANVGDLVLEGCT